MPSQSPWKANSLKQDLESFPMCPWLHTEHPPPGKQVLLPRLGQQDKAPGPWEPWPGQRHACKQDGHSDKAGVKDILASLRGALPQVWGGGPELSNNSQWGKPEQLPGWGMGEAPQDWRNVSAAGTSGQDERALNMSLEDDLCPGGGCRMPAGGRQGGPAEGGKTGPRRAGHRPQPMDGATDGATLSP